jgi:hypothetical protein
MTIPTKAAAEYRANPRATLTSRVADDPPVPLAPGVTLAQFNGETLWAVPPEFKAAVEMLLGGDLDHLTPEAVQDHFAHAGLGGFLPRWTPEELQRITADGKIPDFAKWQSRLASGELGLDALMNTSALQSFVVDQTALDNRIRSVLKSARLL